MAEVAEGVFDSAEDLVVGEIDQFVGQALQEGVGGAAEGLEEQLAACFTPLGGLVSGRSRIVQHGNLPGVASRRTDEVASISPRRAESTTPTRISHLLSLSTPAEAGSNGYSLTGEGAAR